MGKHGLTVDNLLSADVVTADPEFHPVSAEREPDLFWALRGGAGNFGVVTSFEYRLHPFGQILGGLVVYPLDQAADVARFYRDLCPALPDEAETYLAFITEPQAGVPVAAMILGYNGPLDEGEKVLAPPGSSAGRSPTWWARCRMPCARPCSTSLTPGTDCTATGGRPSPGNSPTSSSMLRSRPRRASLLR